MEQLVINVRTTAKYLQVSEDMIRTYVRHINILHTNHILDVSDIVFSRVDAGTISIQYTVNNQTIDIALTIEEAIVFSVCLSEYSLNYAQERLLAQLYPTSSTDNRVSELKELT